jgi:hypothetical protein
MRHLLNQWMPLQVWLRKQTASRSLLPLLRLAVKQQARAQVVLRIYSRYNKLRAQEELFNLAKHKLPRSMK